MKQFFGWSLIFICSLFAFCVLAFIPETKTDEERIAGVIVLIVVLGLCAFGAWRGIRMLRKVKAVRGTFAGEINMMVSSRISFDEYRSLMFRLVLTKPYYIFCVVVILLSVLGTFLANDNDVPWWEHPIWTIAGGILVVFFLMNFQFTRLYKSTKILVEEITYTINNEAIQVKGETVNATMKWAHFFKVKDTPSFILLYSGEAAAVLLKKEMFAANELEELNLFLRSLDLKWG